MDCGNNDDVNDNAEVADSISANCTNNITTPNSNHNIIKIKNHITAFN